MKSPFSFRVLGIYLIGVLILLLSFPASAMVKKPDDNDIYQTVIDGLSEIDQEEIAAYANKRIVIKSFTVGGYKYVKGAVIEISKTSKDGKWVYFVHDEVKYKLSSKKVVSGKVTKLTKTSVSIPLSDEMALQVNLADLVQPKGYVLDKRMLCVSLDPEIVDVDGFGDIWVLMGNKKGTTYIIVKPFYSDDVFKVKVRVKQE